MSHLREIQQWLCHTELAGLVIPSADEFLSKFPPPSNRRLRWATGFLGSSGLAIVLRDAAALFLDGRYRLQGAADTAGSGIEVVPAAWACRRHWLKKSLPANSRIGIDPWCHSILDMEQWRTLADELGIELEMLADPPIDPLWIEDCPVPHQPRVVDYPLRYAGETHEAKCERLVEHIDAAGLHALLLADPEDVSWLFNVRAAAETLQTEVGEWPLVPSCTSRALVKRDGSVTWFVDRGRLDP